MRYVLLVLCLGLGACNLASTPYDTGCEFAPTIQTCPIGSYDSGDSGQ